ncbi:DNA-3-methyladenine glycosylase I [Candidatus Woesearchaeota archaeon]|nr:DNA-3-methyladenine glycosylase I [Candidatus Woesearchaeota archaeon]
MRHKAPWECIYAKEDKNKCRPGNKPKSNQEYFEILCLCILQAGLNWGMVRKNWQRYRNGFYNFNISQLAKTQSNDLIKRENVIKNPKKIEGIIYNAKEFQKIKKGFGSFSRFLDLLNQMKEKDVFKLLMKRFKHVGEYTAEYYLHSVGYWR